MNVIEFIKQEFHQTTAALTGAVAGMTIPVVDIITRIGIGIAVGVGTWCVTKGISFILGKIKCKSECSDSSSPKKEP